LINLFIYFIYLLFFFCRHRVQNIKQTNHPFHPVRAVLLCRDSSVRIISPPQGEVITTLIMPSATGLVDAAYAIAESEFEFTFFV
jgi:hypothetical protein